MVPAIPWAAATSSTTDIAWAAAAAWASAIPQASGPGDPNHTGCGEHGAATRHMLQRSLRWPGRHGIATDDVAATHAVASATGRGPPQPMRSPLPLGSPEPTGVAAAHATSADDEAAATHEVVAAHGTPAALGTPPIHEVATADGIGTWDRCILWDRGRFEVDLGWTWGGWI